MVSGFGPPAIGGNWSDAPAGHGLEGLAIVRGPRAARAGRGGARRAHRRARRATPSATRRPRLGHRRRRPAPTLIRPSWSASPASRGRLAQRRDATRLRHPDRPGALPRRRGRLHRHLGDRRRRRLARRSCATRSAPVLPDGVEAVTGDDAADESASDLLEAISLPHHVPADLRRHLAGRRRLPDRQHLLDPGRPAQPRARAAARARRLEAAGDLVGAARGVRARRARLDDRPRARRAAGDGHPRALRQLRARPVRAAAGLRAAHRRRGVRRRRAGHDGRGLAAGPADRPDRAGAGAARRRRAARDRRCTAGCCSGSCSSSAAWSRSGSGSFAERAARAAGSSAAACSRSCSASPRPAR